MSNYPTVTRKALRQNIIKKFYKPRHPIVSATTTTASDTTTLIDSVLAPAGQTEDYRGAWVLITEVGASGPAVGTVARVTNTSFSGSNSTLTIAPAFSAALLTAMDYELHYKYHPNYIEFLIDEILGNLENPYYFPLTLITDGDMENAPATSFTASNATLANETTTVLHGRKALKITATAANGHARSATVNLPNSTQVLCAADVFITSGDSAKLTLYDVTNSAVLETAESASTGWVRLQFTATMPSTCEQVRLNLESQANTDITYWDNAILLPCYQTQYTPPDEIEYAEDITGLYFWPKGADIAGSAEDFSFRLHEGGLQTFSQWHSERDETAVVPWRLSIDQPPITEPIFIQTLVDYAALASDTATTTAPALLVEELVLAELYDDMADEEEENGNLQSANSFRTRAARTRQGVSPIYRKFRPQQTFVKGARLGSG